MRKSLLLLILASGCMGVRSQTPLEASTFLPKMTMPTPEAFSFTRYGDIPVGLFTGSMTYSIPLFQVSSGKISIPVSLEYATNGVKVDAVPGRTGLDWNLKTGGVITRTILGKPDEAAALLEPDPDSSSQEFYNWVKFTGTNASNTQPDEFSYNFLGYSGKFYVDYEGTIKQLTPAGLKIATNPSFTFFQVTAPDGTLYYFTTGDANYSYSLFGDNNGINAHDGGGTSWYLTKIKNIYGDSVLFNYSQLGGSAVEYAASISQTLRSAPNSAFDGPYWVGSNYAPDFGTYYWTQQGYFGGCQANTGLNTDVRISSMSLVKLDEIIFKDGRIAFYYSSRDDLPGEKKLDSIDLFSVSGSKRIKTIGLEYIYSQSSSTYHASGYISPGGTALPVTYPYLEKRLFLDKVKIYNSAKTDHQAYAFNYEAIDDLPPRLSFSQDLHGYFNGKVNSLFIPDNTLFSPMNGYPTSEVRRAVDTAYSKKGVLKKITYPTGGFTHIQYEPNYIGKGYHDVTDFDTVINTINYTGANNITYSVGFESEYSFKIRLSAEPTGPADPMAPQLDSFVLFSIEKVSDNSCIICNVFINPRESFEITNNLFVLNNAGEFRLKLATENPGMRARAEFIHFTSRLDSNENVPTTGLRVASIKNFTSEGVSAGMKRFGYQLPTGNISSLRTVMNFNDARDFCYVDRSNCSDENTPLGATMVVSSSGSFGGYLNDYGAYNYNYVTEYFDSSGTGGKTVTQFQVALNKLPTVFAVNPPLQVWEYSPFLIPGVQLSNTGYMNGKELSKTIYKYESGNYHKVKETLNYYSTDARLFNVDSFYVIKQAYSRPIYGSYKYFSDFDINEYKRISAWVHLDSTIQKDYENETVLAVKTSYVYGNSSHLQPTEVRQLTSKGDTSKQLTKYADDLRQLDPENTVLGSLVSNNMIHIPLVNQSMLNNKLISTTKIEYNSSLLPATIKTAKGTASLQVEGEYTQYDALGNPLEFLVKGQYNSIITDTSTGTMMAGCVNAEFDHIAYTGFETGSTGNWTIASALRDTANITGNKSYQLSNGNITRGSLSSTKEYILTYWTKNGSALSITGTQGSAVQGRSIGGWTCYMHTITGVSTITISGTGLIDELRLHPTGAQMTTYTYQPLTGITAQCDIANKIIYYEYDDFGRVKLIRDQDKNILKTFDYKFQVNTNQ